MADDAGLGHNDPAAAQGVKAIGDYHINIRRESEGRAAAVAAIVRYGDALTKGRGKRSDKAFGEWIKAQGLDQGSVFMLRQERAAAMQIAKIEADHKAWHGDSIAYHPAFDECPHSRPTNIMTWWRQRRTRDTPFRSVRLTKAHAEAVGERAKRLLREADGKIADTSTLEALASDPYATLKAERSDEAELVEFETKFGTPPKPSDSTTTVRSRKPAAPPDRVHKAADRAEVATLQRELADADEEFKELQARLAAWTSALAREGLSMREERGKVTAVAGLDRVSSTDETRVSIHVLIEKLTPIIKFLRTEGGKRMATSTIIAAEDAAIKLTGLLDQWASDDPTVRRVRGHAVPSKASTKAKPGQR